MFIPNLSPWWLVFYLPSGNLLQFAIQNGPVEIVDLPIKHGDFPWFCVCFPGRVPLFYQTSIAPSRHRTRPCWSAPSEFPLDPIPPFLELGADVWNGLRISDAKRQRAAWIEGNMKLELASENAMKVPWNATKRGNAWIVPSGFGGQRTVSNLWSPRMTNFELVSLPIKMIKNAE